MYGIALKQQGIVLVIVLWIITLLTVMAGSFTYSLRTETLLAASAVGRAQARALAEAGVNYAAMQVLRPVATQAAAWPVDGSEREWQFGQGRLRIAVVDANGKIDLNRANRALLGGLLTSAGVADEALDSLLDAIEDWRDPDDVPGLHGAEKAEYQAAGRALGPKNAPFESVEELQQVLGMTPAIYQRIAGSLTVFSGQPGINPAVASANVLKALPGADPKAIDDYLAARADNAAQGLPPPPPPVASPYLAAGGGIAYHITVQAQLDTGVTVSVEAVVGQSRQATQPYHLFAWREGF